MLTQMIKYNLRKMPVILLSMLIPLVLFISSAAEAGADRIPLVTILIIGFISITLGMLSSTEDSGWGMFYLCLPGRRTLTFWLLWFSGLIASLLGLIITLCLALIICYLAGWLNIQYLLDGLPGAKVLILNFLVAYCYGFYLGIPGSINSRIWQRLMMIVSFATGLGLFIMTLSFTVLAVYIFAFGLSASWFLIRYAKLQSSENMFWPLVGPQLAVVILLIAGLMMAHREREFPLPLSSQNTVELHSLIPLESGGCLVKFELVDSSAGWLTRQLDPLFLKNVPELRVALISEAATIGRVSAEELINSAEFISPHRFNMLPGTPRNQEALRLKHPVWFSYYNPGWFNTPTRLEFDLKQLISNRADPGAAIQTIPSGSSELPVALTSGKLAVISRQDSPQWLKLVIYEFESGHNNNNEPADKLVPRTIHRWPGKTEVSDINVIPDSDYLLVSVGKKPNQTHQLFYSGPDPRSTTMITLPEMMKSPEIIAADDQSKTFLIYQSGKLEYYEHLNQRTITLETNLKSVAAAGPGLVLFQRPDGSILSKNNESRIILAEPRLADKTLWLAAKLAGAADNEQYLIVLSSEIYDKPHQSGLIDLTVLLADNTGILDQIELNKIDRIPQGKIQLSGDCRAAALGVLGDQTATIIITAVSGQSKLKIQRDLPDNIIMLAFSAADSDPRLLALSPDSLTFVDPAADNND